MAKKPKTALDKLKVKYEVDTNELRLKIERLEKDNAGLKNDTRLAEENYEKQVNKTVALQNFMEVVSEELKGVLETLPGFKQEDIQTVETIRRDRQLKLAAAGYERDRNTGKMVLELPSTCTPERHQSAVLIGEVQIQRPENETMESHARRFGRIEGVIMGLLGRIEGTKGTTARCDTENYYRPGSIKLMPKFPF